MNSPPVPPTSRKTSAALTPEDVSNIETANQYVEAVINGEHLDEVNIANDENTSARPHTKHITGIREAKPEPDSSYDKSTSTNSSVYNKRHEVVENYSDYEDLYVKYKQQRNIFYTIITGLAVALAGCLIGLIIVKALPRKQPAIEYYFEDNSNALSVHEPPSSEITDPFKIHQFPAVNAQDSKIAEVFADHSMYQTFYGVTYNGPHPNYYVENSNEHTNNNEMAILAKRDSDINEGAYESSYEIQHQVTVDMALLSRVTKRVRLVYRSATRLTERVIQAITELNLNLKIHLSVSAASWANEEYNIREVLNSAPPDVFEAVYIERDADENTVYKAYKELNAFLQRRKLADKVQLQIVEAQKSQANPLELSENAGVAADFINEDLSRHLYTNLETPSETSEKAKYMTNWICRVVPMLRADIEWFWSNAFDDGEKVSNGIFTQNRELKPAGLPRCSF